MSLKAKERGYCGRHKDHGITTIVFMDIESIETYISTPEEVGKNLELEALINEVIEYRNYILSSPILLKQKSNLLIIKHPELINEWDFIKNEEIDIKLITYGMNIYAYWKCPKNIHESYSKRVSDRTSGTNCKECFIDTKRKHKKKRQRRCH